jgi:hypothetical protein
MNVNNDRVTDKTSKINISHALALCSIKKEFNEKEWIEKEFLGPHSNGSSPFSTPSVADSVEFTETNPAAFSAPGDTAMLETESESEMEANSTGTSSSVLMKQVCLF